MDTKLTFEHLFHSPDNQRDKFYSRIFGIFSEEIVRIWCKDSHSPYQNLGRPTIYINTNDKTHFTVDFTFQSRSDDRIYIGEMKCELEFCKYQFLTLNTAWHIERHGKPAFKAVLELATCPTSKPVKIAGQFTPIHGAILVWGRFSPQGYAIATEQFKFHDVLSVENIIIDLVRWENQEYLAFLNKKAEWCRDFFEGLKKIHPE